MCASSPREKRQSGSESAGRPWRRREDSRGKWYFVSLGLHGLAVVLLIYFTPIRQILKRELERAVSAQPTMGASSCVSFAL